LAVQLEVGPPLSPAHDHAQGPVPVTAVLVPVVQSPVVGIEEKVRPFDVPQEPFTGVDVATVVVVAVVDVAVVVASAFASIGTRNVANKAEMINCFFIVLLLIVENPVQLSVYLVHQLMLRID
jgi:hypothetical protein